MVYYKCIKRVFKFLPLFIFLFLISFIIFSPISNASTDITYEQVIDNTNFTFVIDSDVYQSVQSSIINDSDYYWIAYYEYEGNGNHHWNVFAVEKENVSSGFKFLLKRNASNKVDFWNSNQTCTVYFADYIAGQPLSFTTFSASNLTRNNYYCVEDTNTVYPFFGNIGGSQLQTGSNTYTNIDFPSVSFFTAPYMAPDPSTTAGLNFLQTGDFLSFFVYPGSIDSSQSIYFSAYEVINNEKSLLWRVALNSSSPYYHVSDNDFWYVLEAQQLGWYQIVNGKEYRVELQYVNPEDSLEVLVVPYTWTMSLTAEQIAKQEQQYQADIANGITDLNNFFSDTNYDSSIYGGLPSLDLPDNIPVEQYIDSLFEYLRSAFTSEESIDFRFYVPFSNGTYITVPSNYIEQHLPIEIINIIRTFYWFCIGMYIFKYFWHLIDSIRQGDFFTASEKDIKTEVL